jgi:threonine aldolase
MNNGELVDLRSDTVTRPTPAMRRAMAEAEVGDDVFGEDPTVLRLEERAATFLGCEAGLFLPTGTMGNQVALHVHARAGSEVVLESRCHILNYERAAMAALSGLLPRAIATDRGILAPGDVEAVIQPGDVVHTPTALLALENTHNMAGGVVTPPERTGELVTVAHRHGLPVHLDGARLFNAATALGVPPSELAAGCDSVMICLSKGLGAPAGSLLCGSAAFVERAREVRKMFGGGMRQVGVLAAAGLVALETMVARLCEDHDMARRLGEGLREIPGITVPVPPATNIVILHLARRPADPTPAESFLRRLHGQGILALSIAPDRVRLVTHFDLPANTVERTLVAARSWQADP